jgi:transcriptional regulator with XRE-family HTH domain
MGYRFGDLVLDPRTPLTVTEQIGQQIMLHRTSLRMLQGELASKAGLCQSHLSNIEQGKRAINVEVLAVIASALNCKMADLMPVPQGGKRAA